MKADWYWDPRGALVTIEDFTVRLASEETSALGYTTRALEVTHVPSTTHPLLSTWPALDPQVTSLS